MNTIGKRVDGINLLFTQEVQDEYITRSASLPVGSGYIEGPPYLLWESSFDYGNLLCCNEDESLQGRLSHEALKGALKG